MITVTNPKLLVLPTSMALLAITFLFHQLGTGSSQFWQKITFLLEKHLKDDRLDED
jgi:hypothetical protein